MAARPHTLACLHGETKVRPRARARARTHACIACAPRPHTHACMHAWGRTVWRIMVHGGKEAQAQKRLLREACVPQRKVLAGSKGACHIHPSPNCLC